MPFEKTLVGGRFTMRELLELAATSDIDREAAVSRVFEWYQSRATGFLRATVAAALAPAAAFIVGSLKEKFEISDAAIALGLGATALFTIAALWQHLQLTHLHREHILSLWLLDELKDFDDDLRAHLRDR